MSNSDHTQGKISSRKIPIYNSSHFCWWWCCCTEHILYILKSNPHPFYSFIGLKNEMLIRIACGLDSRLWAGFWKNDRAAVCAIRTIWYNNLLFYLLFILYNIYIFYLFIYSPPPTCPCALRGLPSWAWQKCNQFLRLGHPWGVVMLSRWCEWWYRRM